jgi:hypothetical protein
MKRANYFLIPESPHNIDRLWREASPLGIAGSVFCAALSAGEKARAEARGERE